MKRSSIPIFVLLFLILNLIGCTTSTGDSPLDADSPSLAGEYSDDFGGQSPDEPIPTADFETDPPLGAAQQDVQLPAEAYNPMTNSSQLPDDYGSTRKNPYPTYTFIDTPSWDFQILQVMRGQSAWERILQDDPDPMPPPPGYEYVVVNIYIAKNIIDEKAHDFGMSDIAVVGEKGILHTDMIWGAPSLDFYFKDIYSAEALVGWLDVIVPIDETNLLLAIHLNEWLLAPGSTERLFHYIALEEGAAHLSPPAESINPPNNLGDDPSEPVPLGVTAITDQWEVTVLEVMRGDDALEHILTANANNVVPDEGYEYIVARLRVHYRHVNEQMSYLSSRDFFAHSSTRGDLLPLDMRISTDQLFNWLNANFYPGGTLEAWTAVLVQIDEPNPLLVFSKAQPIYLALQ